MSIPMITLDYPGMPPEIYCPACGKGVCTEAPVETYCPHVCLIHTDAGGDVLWVRKPLKKNWKKRLRQSAEEADVEISKDYTLEDYESEMEWDDLFRCLCDTVTSPSAFGIVVGTHMGPQATAVLVVFDFNG